MHLVVPDVHNTGFSQNRYPVMTPLVNLLRKDAGFWWKPNADIGSFRCAS